MKTLLNTTKCTLILVLGLLFTFNANANSIEGLSFNTEPIQTDLIFTDYYHTDIIYIYKDGKWKKFWKEFFTGFLEEIMKPVASPNNNDNDFTQEELKAIEMYAIKTVRNKETALEIISQLDEVIHADKQYITQEDLASVFKNDNSFRDLLNKIIKRKISEKPDRSDRPVINDGKDKIKTKSLKRTELRVKSKTMKIDQGGKFVINKDKQISIGRLLGRLAGKILKHFL